MNRNQVLKAILFLWIIIVTINIVITPAFNLNFTIPLLVFIRTAVFIFISGLALLTIIKWVPARENYILLLTPFIIDALGNIQYFLKFNDLESLQAESLSDLVRGAISLGILFVVFTPRFMKLLKEKITKKEVLVYCIVITGIILALISFIQI